MKPPITINGPFDRIRGVRAEGIIIDDAQNYPSSEWETTLSGITIGLSEKPLKERLAAASDEEAVRILEAEMQRPRPATIVFSTDGGPETTFEVPSGTSVIVRRTAVGSKSSVSVKKVQRFGRALTKALTEREEKHKRGRALLAPHRLGSKGAIRGPQRR